MLSRYRTYISLALFVLFVIFPISGLCGKPQAFDITTTTSVKVDFLAPASVTSLNSMNGTILFNELDRSTALVFSSESSVDENGNTTSYSGSGQPATVSNGSIYNPWKVIIAERNVIKVQVEIYDKDTSDVAQYHTVYCFDVNGSMIGFSRWTEYGAPAPHPMTFTFGATTPGGYIDHVVVVSQPSGDVILSQVTYDYVTRR